MRGKLLGDLCDGALRLWDRSHLLPTWELHIWITWNRLGIKTRPLRTMLFLVLQDPVSMLKFLLQKHSIPIPCLPCRINLRKLFFHIVENLIAPPSIPLMVRKLGEVSTLHLESRNTCWWDRQLQSFIFLLPIRIVFVDCIHSKNSCAQRFISRQLLDRIKHCTS